LVAALAFAGSADALDSPFVWEVAGPHARHCLVGTVHALPPSMPMPENIEACYKRAQVLVVESIGMTLMSDAQYVRRLGTIAEPAPGGLRTRIGGPMYAQVAAVARSLDLDPHSFDPFQPWFAAQLLGGFRQIESLARFDYGIDVRLYRLADHERKDVIALETDREHDEVLTRMPEDASIQDLQATLDDFARGPDTPGAAALWLAGDENGLQREIDTMHARYPAFHRRLLTERNRAWMPKIRELINGPRPVLIAAGAAHFFGPDNVRQLLWRERRPTPRVDSPPEITAPDPGATAPGR
jgi:uncharacterized protein YbaP (TraB family)